jgi:hypothetical protein
MKGGQSCVPKSKRLLGTAVSRTVLQMRLDRFTVGSSGQGRFPTRDFF